MSHTAVDQFNTAVYEGDAVGNEIVTLRAMLRARRLSSAIYSEVPSRTAGVYVQPWSEYHGCEANILIVHYSVFSNLFDQVFAAPSRKVLLYHNVTPPTFFEGMPGELRDRVLAARDGLPRYRSSVELALADSEYNARDLTDAGFLNVRVFPYVLTHRLHDVPPDESVLRRYRGDGLVNLLVVGRIAPNKCIEDCVLAFHSFCNRIEPRSRLFIAGSATSTEYYLMRLQQLVTRLGLDGSVVFTGRVSQAALNAYYRLADAFLAMSEHEGFCVPLIEAMLFDVPVFAYASCAVPETVRGAGILFSEKNHPEMAEAIGVVVSDPVWKERILRAQREAAAYYSSDAAEQRLSDLLASLGV
ncbi:MAG TPA: glycosyltransferase [Bryobacteraceae bacterium]|nr:glycosyltransferase [Bryobacteraceae bacterium]